MLGKAAQWRLKTPKRHARQDFDNRALAGSALEEFRGQGQGSLVRWITSHGDWFSYRKLRGSVVVPAKNLFHRDGHAPCGAMRPALRQWVSVSKQPRHMPRCRAFEPLVAMRWSQDVIPRRGGLLHPGFQAQEPQQGAVICWMVSCEETGKSDGTSFPEMGPS